MAKWNEALRIEEALGSTARFAGLDETPARRQARNRAQKATAEMASATLSGTEFRDNGRVTGS